MFKQRCATGAVLALASATALASVAGERRAGDTLSLALPLGTLAVEAWRGDWQGAWQLTQTFVLTTGVTEVLKNTTGVTRPGAPAASTRCSQDPSSSTRRPSAPIRSACAATGETGSSRTSGAPITQLP